MDSTTTCCPTLECPAKGHGDGGNMRLHSRKDPRCLCTECPKTCTATQGTVFSRLRTAAETVSLVVTLIAHGCPLQAIVVVFGFDERTGARWVARAGIQGQAVQAHRVEQPRDLGQGQGDELRVTTHKGIVGMALAMRVRTPWWRAGTVSAHRAMTLMRRLIEWARRCAAHRPLLCWTDGFSASGRAMRETFRDPVRPGKHGRPWRRPWRHIELIAG